MPTAADPAHPVSTLPGPAEHRQPLPQHVDVLVVGAGFAGLAAAVRLAEQGRDYLVLERGHDVAGTWRDNSYPGCACDVPSHLYSFSFAPNPDWSRTFSPQPEIYDYLRRVARDRGVLPRVRLGVELLEAAWDAGAGQWRVRSSAGELTCAVLVLATGGLSEPAVPALPGLETFAGTTFHSAAWRHDHDLAGARVGVVGTGASAIQFVPEVRRQAAHVTVFQRTAPWVLPRRDRAIHPVERWVYRHVPGAQRLVRAGIYWGRESWVLGFAHPAVMRLAERRALRWLRSQVPDPQLRATLTPHFRLGCKRVLLSNDWYAALTQPNVDVVTERIVEVRPHAVVTQDAAGERQEHPVDALIFGTGFQVADPPIAHRVRGRDGRTLAELWAETGVSALHGMAIAGFPNLFLLIGPNTGLGHTSVVLMAEAQVDYLVRLLAALDAAGLATVEPRRDVQDAHNAALQRRLAGTVWNAGGCASWYLDATGRNITLWPTFTFTFRRGLARVDLAEYDARPRSPHPAPQAVPA